MATWGEAGSLREGLRPWEDTAAFRSSPAPWASNPPPKRCTEPLRGWDCSCRTPRSSQSPPHHPTSGGPLAKGRKLHCSGVLPLPGAGREGGVRTGAHLVSRCLWILLITPLERST